MSPDQCRAQADQLRRQAAGAKDLSVREQLLLMAADWDKLAKDAEELERRQHDAAI
jgi:hypothetical protein